MARAEVDRLTRQAPEQSPRLAEELERLSQAAALTPVSGPAVDLGARLCDLVGQGRVPLGLLPDEGDQVGVAVRPQILPSGGDRCRRDQEPGHEQRDEREDATRGGAPTTLIAQPGPDEDAPHAGAQPPAHRHVTTVPRVGRRRRRCSPGGRPLRYP